MELLKEALEGESKRRGGSIETGMADVDSERLMVVHLEESGVRK
jgi:hypothetical protein